MAYTEADLEKLEKALIKGERKIQYSDKSVEYVTHDELIQKINYVKRVLKKSKNPLNNQIKIVTGKGL